MLKKSALALGLSLSLATNIFAAPNTTAQKADAIVYGNFYTAQKAKPYAEAVAIKDGKIIYIGTEISAKPFVDGLKTKIYRYKPTQLIVPAFGDGHTHLSAALREVAVSCDEVNNNEAAETSQEEMANSNVENSQTQGENAEILENAKEQANAQCQQTYSKEQMKEAILKYQEKSLANGELMLLNAATNWNGKDEMFEVYEELEAEGKLKINIFSAYVLRPGEKVQEDLDKAIALYERTKGKKFQVNTIKIYMDGYLESGTMGLLKPYTNNFPGISGNYYGEFVWNNQDELAKIISKANKAGLSVHFHTTGDGAVNRALNAIETSQRRTRLKNAANALTHLQLVSEKDFARMAKLNVIAVVNPNLFFKDEERFTQETFFLGKERVGQEFPSRKFFDSGVVVSVGSNYPKTPFGLSKINGIFHGVNRTAINNDENTLLGDEERTSIEQMINANTINVAIQLKADKEKGSIELGKDADFAVLENDITNINPERILPTSVMATFSKGEIVYRKK